MKKSETTNVFDLGLVMDLNPIVTPNNVISNALNATLTTMNGNENSLQNDMGNGRVETAYLPEGYIPLGTAELGGIIYIVSYNPLINKCLIGSFPSPERNITIDELEELSPTLSIKLFYLDSNCTIIKLPYYKLELTTKELHPGDKFLIYSANITSGINYLSARLDNNTNPDKYPRYLKLNVVAILDNGLIVNLNDTLIWCDTDNNNIPDYYISNQLFKLDNGNLNIDEYRNLILSNYNTFISKVDGKLAILALLECIDTFDVSWDAIKLGDNWILYLFLNWTYNNDSDRDKINLYSVGIECELLDWELGDDTTQIIGNYPKSDKNSTDNDILNNLNTTFYTPKYININDILNNEDLNIDYNNNEAIPRRNDGTDNLYVMKFGKTIESSNTNTCTFTIYPGMPFGYLDYLKLLFSINFSKLGSGEINLIEYRYFYNENENTITLNWGLEAYPERNKLIKLVTFDFYEYNTNIDTWVTKYYDKIDSARSILIDDSNKWEDTDEVLTNIDQTYLTYTVPSQGSYSGNFTESLTILLPNNLYLVVITINYNDEKYIKYYRFMYSSNIFNNYYFTVNDYKEIKLLDAIDNYHPLNFSIENIQTTSLTSSLIMKQKDTGEEVNVINKYLIENTQNTVEYLITDTVLSKIQFNVNTKLDNTTFDSIINDILIQEIDSVTTNNATLQIDNNSGVSSSTSSLDPINFETNLEGEYNETVFNGTYTLKITAPLKVEYLTNKSIYPLYTLSLLNVAYRWWLVDGGAKHIYMYLANDYIPHTDPLDTYEDNRDGRKYLDLSGYPTTYNEMMNLLESYDMLVLRFRVYHTAVSGSEGRRTIVGKGDRILGLNATFEWARVYDTKDIDYNPNNGVLILYGFKTSEGKILLFLYGMYGTPGVGYWHGKISSNDGYSQRGTFNKTYLPFAIRHEDALNSDYIFAPFSDYYKLVTNNNIDSIQLTEWGRIYYYSPYRWDSTISQNCLGQLLLSINDVVIDLKNKYPANLTYTEQLNFTINIPINGNISYLKYCDMLLIVSSGETTVYIPAIKNNSPTIALGTFDSSSLYGIDTSNNLQRISYIKEDTGGDRSLAGESVINLSDTKHRILIKNDKLIVTLGSYLSDLETHIMGASEEQNLGVKDIIQLN